ncbi:MAG TPA: hypothetical protein VNK67_05970 [Burkholderiales bacterium]|nr:hypothetical protein [Burkholderiales bacterium]
MSRILDPDFRWTPSWATDIRRTFARVRADVAAGRRLPDGTPVGGYRPLLPAQREVQRRIFEETRHDHRDHHTD